MTNKPTFTTKSLSKECKTLQAFLKCFPDLDEGVRGVGGSQWYSHKVNKRFEEVFNDNIFGVSPLSDSGSNHTLDFYNNERFVLIKMRLSPSDISCYPKLIPAIEEAYNWIEEILQKDFEIMKQYTIMNVYGFFKVEFMFELKSGEYENE